MQREADCPTLSGHCRNDCRSTGRETCFRYADHSTDRGDQMVAATSVQDYGSRPHVLVFSADLGTLATFEVLFRRSAVIHAASTQAATASLLSTMTPALTVLEFGDVATASLSVLHM